MAVQESNDGVIGGDAPDAAAAPVGLRAPVPLLDPVPATPSLARRLVDSPLGRRYRRLRRRVSGVPDLERLQRRGLRLNGYVGIESGARIDPDFPWLIEIGGGTVLSIGVLVLAHDASTRTHVGYTRLAPVKIGARVFIGAYAVVLPGVTIGDDAIIGAGSVVTGDIPPGVVAAGNPARVLKDTASYAAEHRERLEHRPHWPLEGWTTAGGITEERKAIMREAMADGEAYVK